MYQEYKYIKRILNEEVRADNYFVYCAEMDSQEEVQDETKWIKAMPFQNQKNIENYTSKCKSWYTRRIEKGTSYHKILIKNFNLWQAQREDKLARYFRLGTSNNAYA